MRTKKTRRSSSPLPADILLTLGELGVGVDKVSGDEAWALCPYHDDRKPSWSINLNTGEHHCFSCGWSGSYIDLVKHQTKTDIEKAREWVRSHGGVEVAARKLRGEVGVKKKVAEEVTEADLALFTDPPTEALLNKDVDLESCKAYGVRYDTVTDSWIFPIREPYTDRLLGWQGKSKRVFLNYPNHVNKAETLFGFNQLLSLPRPRTAYLYEAPIEPIRLHTYSVEGGVASMGVHISSVQMSLLCDEVDTLYLCLDNDDAGRKVEAEIWENYRNQVRMLFANYEKTRKKDHGEMEPQEVQWSLDNAISALRYRPC